MHTYLLYFKIFDKVATYLKKLLSGKRGKTGYFSPSITKTFLCAHTCACSQVARQYGGSAGLNMAAFPQFNFADQPLDSVNISN
jgi:hypothetical protein